MTDGIEVKVCGITEVAAARAAVDAGADHLGLVFAPSLRWTTRESAAALVEAVPASWVGVFQDPRIAELVRLVVDVDLAAIQLHGRESPEFCREAAGATGRPIWKALPWTGDPTEIEPYAAAADRVLLDDARGGSGRSLPWTEIADRLPPGRRTAPIVLAGGLGPGNVARAIEIVSPDGVDASSRLESAPGKKDPEKVRAYVAAARRGASREEPS